ncbi:MAG: IS110 family transposase [Gammaproteobacteria bacterium]|nr:IS110 family transposase [Gammaproteobacteria bacterium]
MNVTTIGIDLAKNSFSVHGADERGKTVFRKTLSRAKLMPFLAQQPACLIGMEACSGAHHWARQLTELGHRVGIMAPKFVIPYRKGGKNDGNDAEAICEAVARPRMRFVPIKSAEQQAVLCLHRIRQARIKERTATLNQLRGLLSEFGLVMPQGRYPALHHIPGILEDAENGLPMLARRLLHDLYLRLQSIHSEILAYDRELEHLAKASPPAQQLMSTPGVGAITATAILASVGDAHQFKNGRQFAAWLGLTPRQYTTGGNIRLGRITKKGDAYLRTLLIHGTRAVLAALGDKQDRLSVWLRALIARRGYKRATVALAAKNARILWALMVHGESYQRKAA